MSSIYANAHPATKNLSSSFGLGLLMVTGTFLILPILTTLPNPFEGSEDTEVTTGTVELPKPITFTPPPKKKDPQDLKKPILEKKLPPITLIMLEQLIHPGDGGAGIAVGFNNLNASVETDTDVFMPDMLDKRPRALVPAKPLYPYSMRGVAGEVVVEFIIDAAGKVRRPRVVKSSDRAFESPALDSINKTRWQPGEKNGQTVKTLVRLTIAFKG